MFVLLGVLFGAVGGAAVVFYNYSLVKSWVPKKYGGTK